MRARRATQVDRQVGQSGQLGHNQHTGYNRALIDTELYKHREPGYYTNIEELRAPGDIEFRESPSHAHTHAPLQRETSHTTSRPQKPKRLGDRTLGIGMHGALVTPVASLVTYCSDRPATCTSARAVAHGRVHLQ